MPSTYTLISSNVLASTTASVTFSAIPQTYTDLVLKVSSRATTSQIDGYFRLRFNGDTGQFYSNTYMVGAYDPGTGKLSSRGANATAIGDLTGQVYANATSNTFGSAEVYIPSYTLSQNKPLSNFGVPETDATAFNNGVGVTAGLWRNTGAINTILIYPASDSFVSGSSFYLYGIKNS
jgi:hypothetical protein